ncbi:MAG: class I SAM-dependent methyltransferase [Vulcanimicrobiaceae bacterium]
MRWPTAFARIDCAPDEEFYAQPRFVEHIDARAIDAVTELYRERLPAGGIILDLMSSWISHLPPEVDFGAVAGVGMNAAELGANPRLDTYVVHDLNATPVIPYDDAVFDAATICVSIQYLTRPVVIARELARVLRPGAPLIVTFSNRCFPTKAVALWQALNDDGHAGLVASYLREAGGWDNIESLDRTPPGGDVLRAVIARRVMR